MARGARRSSRETLIGGIFGSLSSTEQNVEERLRTLALCVCALGVVGAALFWMRSVLVPFVLAVALKELLTPVVEGLARLWLPRFAAALVALVLAAAALGALGIIVGDSVSQFSARSGEYYGQVKLLFSRCVEWLDTHLETVNHEQRLEKVKQLIERLPVAQLAITVVESLLALLPNLLLVLLFAVYLLLGDRGDRYDDGGARRTHACRSARTAEATAERRCACLALTFAACARVCSSRASCHAPSAGLSRRNAPSCRVRLTRSWRESAERRASSARRVARHSHMASAGCTRRRDSESLATVQLSTRRRLSLSTRRDHHIAAVCSRRRVDTRRRAQAKRETKLDWST